MVIGGQAMLQEGMPRFTLDWDIFIPPFDQENFAKINAALADDLDMELEPLDIQAGEGFVQTFQTSAGISSVATGASQVLHSGRTGNYPRLSRCSGQISMLGRSVAFQTSGSPR